MPMAVWELISGEQPFRNMMQMEVMRKVVLERKRPEFPPWTPPEYKALVEQCWCDDPHRRYGLLSCSLPAFHQWQGCCCWNNGIWEATTRTKERRAAEEFGRSPSSRA